MKFSVRNLKTFLNRKGITPKEFIQVTLALSVSLSVAVIMLYGAVCALVQ
jgi:hypothetical protein